METSAKTGFNAKNVLLSLIQVFIEAAKLLYEDYLLYKDTYSRSSSFETNSNVVKESNIKLPKFDEKESPRSSKTPKKDCCQ